MRRICVILVVAAVAIAAFSLGMLKQGRAVSRAADLSELSGRYQLTEGRFEWTDKNGNSGAPAFAPFLVDTMTGRVWMYSGPNAQVMNSPIASPAGVGGFDQVQFNGAFAEDKNGKLVPHISYLPR